MSRQRNTTPRRQDRPNRRYRRLLPTVFAAATLLGGAGAAPPAPAKAKDPRRHAAHVRSRPEGSGHARTAGGKGTLTADGHPSLHQTCPLSLVSRR